MAIIERPVKGYEGFYTVDTAGVVRSVDRVHWVQSRWGKPMRRTRKGIVLRPHIEEDGYHSVRLSKDGQVKAHRVARLVLEVFVGCGDGLEAGHLDDCPSNNALANLAWQTRAENEQQKTSNGRRPDTTRGLFTRDTAELVREMRNAGFLLNELADLFDCHVSTVGLICQTKTWR